MGAERVDCSIQSTAYLLVEGVTVISERPTPTPAFFLSWDKLFPQWIASRLTWFLGEVFVAIRNNDDNLFTNLINFATPSCKSSSANYCELKESQTRCISQLTHYGRAMKFGWVPYPSNDNVFISK